MEPAAGEAPTTTTTTAEQDRHTRGARRVDILREATQAAIAISVTMAIVCATLGLFGSMTSETLTNAFFLIVGFYFGAKNHERAGGVRSVR